VLEIEGSDPYSAFIFAMPSPKTREKCIGRLRTFFDFIQIPEGDISHHCKVLCKTINTNNTAWLLANILKLFQYQREKFERKEIVAGTVKNYYQAVKLFCDMNDIPIPWKKIRKGLPKVRKFSDDRAPTIGKLQEKDEEIRSLKEEFNSMRSEMNDVLEVLKIGKSRNGRLGKDRTMLDEKHRVTFGYIDDNNQIVEVKIPLDGIEIDQREFH
jgi:hypothetical protein